MNDMATIDTAARVAELLKQLTGLTEIASLVGGEAMPGDGATIDGGINGVAMGIVPFVTRLAGRAQSGYLFHYAFAMVIGLVALLAWISITSVG